MELKPIRTEAEYEEALQEINVLFDAEPRTPEGDKLDILVMLVEAYEEQHYPIPLPDPIEAICYHMERLNITRQDLEVWIGSRSRVWEIMNRRRHLTLPMIRNLNKELGIPMEVLAQEYKLAQPGIDILRNANTIIYLGEPSLELYHIMPSGSKDAYITSPSPSQTKSLPTYAEQTIRSYAPTYALIHAEEVHLL